MENKGTSDYYQEEQNIAYGRQGDNLSWEEREREKERGKESMQRIIE